MYSVSVCSLCSLCSEMNGAAWQFILWIKLVAVLCKSWWRLRHCEICFFVELPPFSCKCCLEHVAFHLIILFENLAIPWLFGCLAYVNVDKVTRNHVYSGKWNFHVLVLVNTMACHAVTVCKICKSTWSHTIISRKTLFVTKSDIFTSIWVINFPLVNFI